MIRLSNLDMNRCYQYKYVSIIATWRCNSSSALSISFYNLKKIKISMKCLKDPLSLTVMLRAATLSLSPRKSLFVFRDVVANKSVSIGKVIVCSDAHSFKGKIIRLVVTLRCCYFILCSMLEGFSFHRVSDASKICSAAAK